MVYNFANVIDTCDVSFSSVNNTGNAYITHADAPSEYMTIFQSR